MKLGETSTTGDEEGEKTDVSMVQPEQSVIEMVLQKFSGELMQRPPIYSAVKVNGHRAYKLAREGKEVALAARPITIYRNQFIDYSYPYVRFIADVSSGTYIRSLVEDMGTVLGTGAYMSALSRSQVGNFKLSGAHSGPLQELQLTQQELLQLPEAFVE
jgi:tRNA pseudouridine55 synthase